MLPQGDPRPAGDLYRQLGTHLEVVEPGTDEHRGIVDRTMDGLPDGASVVQVVRVSRATNEDTFAYDIKPARLMFHGTNARNAIGILQRGILQPKVSRRRAVSVTGTGADHDEVVTCDWRRWWCLNSMWSEVTPASWAPAATSPLTLVSVRATAVLRLTVHLASCLWPVSLSAARTKRSTSTRGPSAHPLATTQWLGSRPHRNVQRRLLARRYVA